MHIFIDESGGFQCTNRPVAISCVGAAIIPGRRLKGVELGFIQLSRAWPRDEDGEIKGRLLHEPHFAELCRFLEPRDVLLACATEAEVAHHRHLQAQGMTVNLTPEHYPSLVTEVHRLREVLEAMPLQLYAELVN